jgi:mRNA-degrading endonuclease RelE of RelBE toxin-antitoxin system
MFELDYADDWDIHFLKLDNAQQERIWKRIQKLKELLSTRHLKHGLPFFVLETGQYRICYLESSVLRTIIFAGTHKQYEKWYKNIVS